MAPGEKPQSAAFYGVPMKHVSLITVSSFSNDNDEAMLTFLSQLTFQNSALILVRHLPAIYSPMETPTHTQYQL